MRFDAYAGTVREVELRQVADALVYALKGELEEGPAVRRYGTTLQVVTDGRQAAWIGHDEANGCIYFEGKGDTSPQLAAAVRRDFPDHSVARADVCEDFDAPGAFGRLQGLIRAKKGGQVKGAYVHLSDDEEDGKTWVCGVRGAKTYLRLYEAGKMKERLHLAKPDWVRCELECRPHYAADKQAAAHLEPLHFWGMSRWSRAVGSAVLSADIPRFDSPHEATSAGTFVYCARTFRRMWEGMLSDGEHIESSLRQVWADDDRAKEVLAQLRSKRGAPLH